MQTIFFLLFSLNLEMKRKLRCNKLIDKRNHIEYDYNISFFNPVNNQEKCLERPNLIRNRKNERNYYRRVIHPSEHINMVSK